MNADSKLMAIDLFKYDPNQDSFSSRPSIIEMKLTPFAEGGMRKAYNGYHYQDCKVVVIKRYMHEMSFDTVSNDVKMQSRCQHLASAYNARLNSKSLIAKEVEFVDAFMIKLAGGPWDGEYGVMEYYLPGEYIKHGSNWPAGIPFTNRNTPQAFSHFTYLCTGGQELVCDMQGVDDTYTDPQIHSVDGSKYGQGNLGPHGIQSFLLFHQCSQICTALGLPNTRPGTPVIDGGTVPNYLPLK